MDPARWSRVWKLFETALQQPAEQRTLYLLEACGGDEGLLREVSSLLAAHTDQGSRVGQAVSEAMADMVAMTGRGPADPADPAGTRLGPYRIVRVLGRGGMGVVYLAVRADDEYRREVAIKVVRGGLHSPDLIRRFLGERQILADLDHPNIARLLDGGTTPEGFPYVVMEYVQGEAIDRYCDRVRLPVRERLLLFCQVCAAVQSAHSNLVVHRDIKPANILVTPEGVPKLLDFGIAKLLDPEAEGAMSDQTGTAMRLLTPDYASPEQVRGSGITTSSDVYSLGVLLYELLTGRLPHRRRGRSAVPIEQAICETEPERPSATVSPISGSDAAAVRARELDSIAVARATTPQRLRRRLTGDLDNILLMALRKEPERRYASADQLAEEVRRHLAGQPVVARGDSWGYRARKFVSRNRLGVTAAAVIVLLLAGLAASATVQSVRIGHERDRAVAAEAAAGREAERARTEAESSRRVADFLVELFKVVDPEEARGRDVTAREILDRGAARISRELTGEPTVQSRMMNTIARVYQNLGLMEEAARLARQGLDVRRGLRGASQADVAESLGTLGSIEHARGDHAGAERHLREALESLRAMPEVPRPALIAALDGIGRLRHTQGRLEEARKASEEALALARQEHGETHEVVATCLNNLSTILVSLGQYEKAEGLQRATLQMREKIMPENHPDIASSVGNLGRTLDYMGRLEEAESLLRRNLELNRILYPANHSDVGLALSNLAAVLKKAGRPQEAEPLQRQALDTFLEAYGEAHPLVALCYNNLANLRHDQSDYEGAEALHRKSLAINRKLFGPEHPSLADSLNNLGNLLWDKGDSRRAAPLFRQALALDRKLLGEKHPYVAMDLHALAMALADSGEPREAERLYREAIAMNASVPGSDAVSTATYEGSLGLLLVNQGRALEAETLLRGSLEVYEKRLPRDHWQIHQARGMLGRCLAVLGRLEEAESLLTGSVEGMVRLKGERSGATRRAREHMQVLIDVNRERNRVASPERGAAVGAADGG